MGANIEIGASGTSSIDENDQFESIPEYTLQPGCSADVGGNSPLEYFSLLFSRLFPVQPRFPSRQKHPHRSLPRSRRVRRWEQKFFVPDPWSTGDGGGVDVAYDV